MLYVVGISCFYLFSIHPPFFWQSELLLLNVHAMCFGWNASYSFPRVGIHPRPHSVEQTTQSIPTRLNLRAFAGILRRQALPPRAAKCKYEPPVSLLFTTWG